MRNTSFFLTGVVFLFVQANLYRLTALVHALVGWHMPVPSLVLPLIVFMGVHEYSAARGAGVAFVLGYATDVMGVAPIGLYTFTYVAVFMLGRAAGVRLAAQTLMMQLALALAFAFVHAVMLLVLIAIFGRDAYVARTLAPLVLPQTIATAACAPLVFRLARRVHALTVTGRAEIGGEP